MTKEEKRMIAEKAADYVVEMAKAAQADVRGYLNREKSESYRRACDHNAAISAQKAVSILDFLGEIGLLTFKQKHELIDDLCAVIYEEA